MRRLVGAACMVLGLLSGSCSALPVVLPGAPGLQTGWIAGNQVTLLFDGPQTMQAMEEAIHHAKHSIHLETYIFDQDAIGLRFALLLMERQRAGVATRIIYDAVGTLNTPQAFFEQLRAAGIRLHAFNPINPLRLDGPWRPNNRDHRKILVVDGKLAFTGGVNISASYSRSSLFRSKKRTALANVGWRDTHLRLQGPAVSVLQAIFLKTWNAHNPGTPSDAGAASDAGLFPTLQPAGNTTVRVLASEPNGQAEIYAAYLEAIAAARKSIYITSAYFVPDAAMLGALLQAARRGVEVRLILPGVQEGGGLVFYASQSLFERMLEGGIHIHQMQIAVLHAKTAVIDGKWSTVGSTNLDTRSFLHNSEVNVVMQGEAFGTTMQAAFAEDLRNSRAVLLNAWKEPPLKDRMKEWLASCFGYWL
ncbi:MAG: phospholipase D-like domain-containing protein [Rhodoferax sp.]|nr:phospholipase D-like domain-containing protein [Rhodoferax sp.]